jgi:hypothetical protein
LGRHDQLMPTSESGSAPISPANAAAIERAAR